MKPNNSQFAGAYFTDMIELIDGKLTPRYFRDRLPKVLSGLHVYSDSYDYFSHGCGGVTGAEYNAMRRRETKSELEHKLAGGLKVLRQLNLVIQQTEDEELKAFYIISRRMLNGHVNHAERLLKE